VRKLVTLREISDIQPIPGADFIDMAQVDGWRLVVKKDEFRVGDLCCYHEIDSVCPERPEYEFLRESKFRVKTRKFKKQISQGLALPISILPKDFSLIGTKESLIGMDVTEILGVKKFEPGGLSRAERRKGLAAFSPFRKRAGKPFPTDIAQKTDEERVQNMKGDLERLKGQTFYVTEKLHGQSFTAYLHNDKFGVCSRNFDLQKPGTGLWEKICEKLELRKHLKTVEFKWTKLTQERNLKLCNWVRKNVFRPLSELVVIDVGVNPNFWNLALKLDLEKRMRDACKSAELKGLVLQGEMCGPDILGNQLSLKEIDLYTFYYTDPETREKYNFAMFRDLNEYMDLKPVPVLDENFVLNHTCDELLALAEGKSVINPNQEREGLVLRSHDMKESFKVVSNKWLLKHDG
jgi:RNA ligase (TIGR02306 family)